MTQQITVRVRSQRGRLRLQSVADGLYVQCPRSWRETLPAGRPIPLAATLRADGKCWVATEQGQPGDGPRAPHNG